VRIAPPVLAAAAAVLLLLPASAAGQAPPDLSRAASAILVDASDGTVLSEKSPRARRPIASTTKLMTALLALERAEPGDLFTAPAYRALAVESKINLREGERMRVSDLLEALLLESANDAAVTIAEGVSGSREAFVSEMNSRARALGLRDTRFANPIGLDDPGNYSTAADLATLTRRLLRNRRFAAIVDSPSAVLESGARRRVVGNRNGLVSRFPFVDGVKTGRTRGAGNVLVGAAGGRLGARVVSVVMGEPSEAARDADTLALLRFGLSRFRIARPLDDTRPVASAAIAHRDERARLVPAEDVRLSIRRGERLRTRVTAPGELEGELPAGRRVGSVTVLLGDRVLRRVPLVTAAEVPGAGPLRVLVSALGGPLTALAILGMLVLTAMGAIRLRSRRRERELAERRRQRARARARAEG
jgi:serine-type D-Ala-D-Ala carboxypeptidase (penicillin-binding protein 5/6)